MGKGLQQYQLNIDDVVWMDFILFFLCARHFASLSHQRSKRSPEWLLRGRSRLTVIVKGKLRGEMGASSAVDSTFLASWRQSWIRERE